MDYIWRVYGDWYLETPHELYELFFNLLYIVIIDIFKSWK